MVFLFLARKYHIKAFLYLCRTSLWWGSYRSCIYFAVLGANSIAGKAHVMCCSFDFDRFSKVSVENVSFSGVSYIFRPMQILIKCISNKLLFRDYLTKHLKIIILRYKAYGRLMYIAAVLWYKHLSVSKFMKPFSCSGQMSMNFITLISIKSQQLLVFW